MVEQFFTALVWQLLGDHGVGMAVTGGLGNQSKADIVLNLSRQQPNNSELVSDVEFACRAFNIIRENRNILLHSHTILPTEDGAVNWRRATGRGPKGHVTTRASFDDVEALIQSTCNLGLFACHLMGLARAAKTGEEPTKRMARFKMPQRLKQVEETDD